MTILLNIQSFNDDSLYNEIINISLNKSISNIFLVSSLMHDLEENTIKKYEKIKNVKYIYTNSLFTSTYFSNVTFETLNVTEQNGIYTDILSSFRWMPVSKRNENDSFSFAMTIHYDVYNFWNIFFDKNKVDSIISLQAEHSSCDKILIEVAREKGVENILTTIISGWQANINEEYFSIYDNIRSTALDLKNYKDESVLSNKYDYNAVQNHSNKYTVSKLNNLFLILNKVKILLKTSDSYASKINILKSKLIDKLYTKISLYSQLRYIGKLRNYYQDISLNEINIENKYIYYCLHFDPEATTLPKDTVFSNQLLNIRIISSALPKGWKLYVKEHPHQLNTDLYKNIFLNQLHAIDIFRSKSFYTYINQLNNVHLVSLDIEHKQLIQNAEYIVSNTGTVFREATNMKKQCITFSKKSIYNFLNNVYCVENCKDCEDIFDSNNIVKYESIDELFNRYTISITDIDNRASILLKFIISKKLYKELNDIKN